MPKLVFMLGKDNSSFLTFLAKISGLPLLYNSDMKILLVQRHNENIIYLYLAFPQYLNDSHE